MYQNKSANVWKWEQRPPCTGAAQPHSLRSNRTLASPEQAFGDSLRPVAELTVSSSPWWSTLVALGSAGWPWGSVPSPLCPVICCVPQPPQPQAPPVLGCSSIQSTQGSKPNAPHPCHPLFPGPSSYPLPPTQGPVPSPPSPFSVPTLNLRKHSLPLQPLPKRPVWADFPHCSTGAGSMPGTHAKHGWLGAEDWLA